jgi:two-component system sensor histidine kinase CpxA
MLLLACAVAATVYLTDPQEFFPRAHVVPMPRIEALAASAVETYEQKGPAALAHFLDNAARSDGPQPEHFPPRFNGAYLFDGATGQELSGRRTPVDSEEVVGRAQGSADLQLERFLNRLLMARGVHGPAATGSKPYVFMVSMPRTSLWLPTTPRVWFSYAAALLVSALVCYWLARYVLEPVRRLQHATRKLAGGDLSARVLSTPALARRRDEFSELARDFDEMAYRIESLLSAQRRLIADISHELGSPLTRVNVALGLAFRKANPEVRPELERIQREASRLNDLIRQLLLLAELENRSELAPVERVHLSELARDVAADAEFEAGSRHCRVRVAATDGGDASSTDGIAPFGPQVSGVVHLLRSAIDNVVRNAVRYTAPDTEVLIEVGNTSCSDGDSTGDHAIVRVRDRGPGVPQEALADLFRPFYRVSEARDRQSGGTGLGLAIAQQAVEAHGGRVRAYNDPEGGLVVELDLPPGK